MKLLSRFAAMAECWCEHPMKRPDFTTLRSRLAKALEDVISFLFSTFSSVLQSPSEYYLQLDSQRDYYLVPRSKDLPVIYYSWMWKYPHCRFRKKSSYESSDDQRRYENPLNDLHNSIKILSQIAKTRWRESNKTEQGMFAIVWKPLNGEWREKRGERHRRVCVKCEKCEGDGIKISNSYRHTPLVLPCQCLNLAC